MADEVHTVCFPHEDALFAGHVQRLVEAATTGRARLGRGRGAPSGRIRWRSIRLGWGWPPWIASSSGMSIGTARSWDAVPGCRMKLHVQAVLRRSDLAAPLRLAGVLVAGSFYPMTVQEAWGPLNMEVGLVALAPLTPVITDDAAQGAESALREARSQWRGVDPMASGDLLSWLPIGQVREIVAGEDIAALLVAMTAANATRSGSTPSTPPYHAAARELERLAGVVYEATSAEERAAEALALRQRQGIDALENDA